MDIQEGSEGKSASTIIPTTEQVRNKWDQIAIVYNPLDPCMQTFYFTLIHMMRLEQANHILEVACGTGKFLQLAVNLKQKDCTYLASDLCPNMIALAKKNLESWIGKLGLKEEFEVWAKDHNLQFAVKNGEQKLDFPFKFDRIICNLVLHLTEDPEKMLRNLNEAASSGCLLGLSVLTYPLTNGFLSLAEDISKQLGLPTKNMRSFFHMENRIAEMALKTGWDVVVEWHQNAPIGDFSATQSLKAYAQGLIAPDPKIYEEVLARIDKTYSSKNVLNFPTQMAILRKK